VKGLATETFANSSIFPISHVEQHLAPVFVIFGHFQKAFYPIFLGVQTQVIIVIAPKKSIFLYPKRPFGLSFSRNRFPWNHFSL
jgi:hypothetical protein